VNAIVLGGGFIGSAAARKFDRAGHAVTLWTRGPQAHPSGLPTWVMPTEPGPRGPMPLQAPLEERARASKPDVLLLAAGLASVGESVEQPEKALQETVTLATRVLEALAQGHPACRFLIVSSAAVYGNPAVLPVSEEAPAAPISPYGQAKWNTELEVRRYAERFGLKALVLRPFSVYGEEQRRLVVSEIIQQILDPKRSEILLMGTGQETRDYIHIDDLASAMVHLAGRSEFPSGPLNVASGASTSILEIAERLRTISGRALPVRALGKPRPGNPDHWQADIRRLQSLGFSPVVTLADGLRRCYEWAAAASRVPIRSR
jgi:nucleoside-diphosphate-sugar epimerase